MKRVLVIEDKQIHIEAAKKQFAGSDEFELIGIATNFKQAVEMISELKPEIVMSDVMIPYNDRTNDEEAYGIIAGLKAVECGCEKVIFVSDMSRHDNTLLMALCTFNDEQSQKIMFPYNNMKRDEKNWIFLLKNGNKVMGGGELKPAKRKRR